MISTGATTESAAGTLQLAGGTSEQGQGGDVDILGGQSNVAGTGGRVLIGKFFTFPSPQQISLISYLIIA